VFQEEVTNGIIRISKENLFIEGLQSSKGERKEKNLSFLELDHSLSSGRVWLESGTYCVSQTSTISKPLVSD
jgi:hypothetical protein